MSVSLNKTSFVGAAAQTIGLSQMFNVTAGSSNPTYLVLTALDRNEYTARASGAVGMLSGNGHTLSLSGIGSDGRGTGVVFTYQAATGRYYNSLYGYFDQLSYVSSGCLADLTNLSLFGTSNLSQATAYAGNAYAMMQVDAAGYLGSATVATQPAFAGAVPAQATPNSIASVASSFIGQAWNTNGCWVLASTIAAEAGASLPVQSTAIGVPGQANGEWIVAFNGPAGQSGNWQSLVHTGEMVVIGFQSGGGHITTCVSGSGSTAMLVDNITYVNGQGQVTDLANDGSSSDIVVASPHPASQEWSGVLASSVVIYELDTPVVAATVASDSLACLATQSLGSLFTASDPVNRSITTWQVYDTAAADSLVVGATSYAAHSAASAVTAATLGSISLRAGSASGTDTLEVRAFNGPYWGDWQALAVTVTASAAPSAPILSIQTPNQTWTGGKPVTLALPSATFADPQHQTLHYAATLSSGQALPGWLAFNPATETFSGTPPLAAQSLSIKVTATDASALSAADTFSVTVLGPPALAAQTPSQTWQEGKPVSLALAANTFIDPQGQSLSYVAAQANEQALPGWLTFNAANRAFGGTAPATAQTLSIKVTATDSSGLSASETFAASMTAPAAKPGIAVSLPTAPQTWVDGQSVDLTLPGNTFTDALGLKMTFAAYQVGGPDVTSWLRFNPTTDELIGKVPASASGTTWLEVVATDAQKASATDLFPVTFVAGSTHGIVGADKPFGAPPAADVSHLTHLLAFHS